jgi:hypothetical protein
MSRLRCSLRGGLRGWYSGIGERISLPVWAGLPAPDPRLVVQHELAHRDLTEKTICGWFDRLLAHAAEDNAIAPSARAAVGDTFERMFDGSFKMQEGTATYSSLVAFANTRNPGTEVMADLRRQLPPAYQSAVSTVLQIFPRYDEASPQSTLFGLLAVYLARWALDWPRLDEIIASAPRTWEELERHLLATTADAVWEGAVQRVHGAGGLPWMQQEICRCLGYPDWAHLEEKYDTQTEAEIFARAARDEVEANPCCNRKASSVWSWLFGMAE